MDKKECIRVFADKEQIASCKKKVGNVEKLLGSLSAVFNLAGNKVRLSILYLLYEEEKLCVCDLSDIMDMQIPAISQHLRKMKDGGIVEKNRVGAIVYYSLKPECSQLLKSFFQLISDQAISETKAA